MCLYESSTDSILILTQQAVINKYAMQVFADGMVQQYRRNR